MSVIRKIKEKGLSLKTYSHTMLFVSIVVTVLLIASSIVAYVNFMALEHSSDNFIELEETASDLMEASDYLTEQVQCYTVLGEREYLDNYFVEAFETKRRENAIAVIEEFMPDSPALANLKDSMSHSVELMDTEYYAMRLVLEAYGDTDIPASLQDVVLTEEDSLLSPEDKLDLARTLVHNADYYEKKDNIRENCNECLEDLKATALQLHQKMESRARWALIAVMILIVVQTLIIIGMIWIHNFFGIQPVLNAVAHIKKDENIPIVGASEIRYLAGAYNFMYNAYKNSISHLNFKASHDELTGVYNRAGYEIIKNSVDITTTAMMIIDADKFKHINDTYGHEVGDKVLKRVANTLKSSFRSDDYICRIGGDEFLIFMVHLVGDPRVLIESKITSINQQLGITEQGVPPITLSAGVAFTDIVMDPDVMFQRADTALYYMKENGRNGCCFYTDDLETLASRHKTAISKKD